MEPDGPFDLANRVQLLSATLSVPGTPLEQMAIAVSAVLDPELDVAGALATLDELAASCPATDRDAVIDHLFGPAGGAGFRGDRRSYHDLRNSCLDQVLARRTGMPITLAVVAVAVAARCGLQLVGVGMPGHFLVGDADDPCWFADPYGGRTGLAREDCRAIFEGLGAHPWSERYLRPVPDRLVIARILNNMKASCEMQRDRVGLALVMHARQTMPEFHGEADAAAAALAVFN